MYYRLNCYERRDVDGHSEKREGLHVNFDVVAWWKATRQGEKKQPSLHILANNLLPSTKHDFTWNVARDTVYAMLCR